MARTADVIIIGAGVVGCSVAYHLAGMGVKGIVVLDRGRVGGEASGAAAGMLAPQCEAAGPGPFLDFCLAARRYYERFEPELKACTQIDIEYLDWGILYLLDEEGDEAAEGRYRWQTELGLQVERLTREEVGKLEPGLTREIGGALFFPGDHHVNNTELTRALAQAARSRGVRIVEGCPVTGFLYEGDRVAGVRTPLDVYTAPHIILCAGAWSGQLGTLLGRRMPVEPARGQILYAELQEPPLRHPVWGREGYLVPRLNGGLIVGSTVEYVGFEKTVTLEGIRSLSALALSLVPTLAEQPFTRAWAGFRPHAKDGLPVIGPLQGLAGLTVATGHFRNGILLSPFTGRLVAELVLGESPSFPLDPFSPTRFGL
ncbi:MAG: glycine oxidase ThiO [Candidatus Methylomirabilales bacterium]